MNKVISIGEKARWKGSHDESKGGQLVGVNVKVKRERWVQFRTEYSSSAPIKDIEVESDGIHDSEYTIHLLREYLVLPTSEYSLLDPRWVQRDENGAGFLINVPLDEILGVNLTPSLCVTAHPNKDRGTVRFVCSDASLGSILDEAFKLKITAVMRSTNHRRKNKIPQINFSSNSKSNSNDKLSLSRKDNHTVGQGSVTTSWVNATNSEPQGVSGDESIFLHCDVDISMAIRVPKPLKVVPNALLGYAGRLITRAVLSGAMPNFVELLSKDFSTWAASKQSRDRDAQVGLLFESKNESINLE